MAAEQPLAGGNSNAPVRIGETVRRTAGPWTPAVHDLLRHLRARGVTWLPEPLGLDEQGREVLRFVPGVVPTYPMPSFVWQEEVLATAARMLRTAHDASIDFPAAGRVWQRPAHPPVEVVCLGDFAPYNFVFAEDRLNGAIDVDMASPGPRTWDLAHLAHRLVPLTVPGDPDTPSMPVEQRRDRLRLLCEAYEGVSPAGVLAAVPARLKDLATYSDERAAVLPELAEHAERYRADALWVRTSAAALGA